MGQNWMQILRPGGSVLGANQQDIIERMRGRADALYSAAQKQLSQLHEQLDSLNVEVEKTSQSATELRSQLTEQKSRADDVIAQFQKTAQEREDARTDAFNKLRDSFRQEHSSVIDETKNKAAASLDEIESDAQETKDKVLENAKLVQGELSEILSKSRNLFELIGNTAITGKFSKAAENHAKTANRYRWAGMILLIVAAGAVLWLIYEVPSTEWQAYLGRFTASLMLLLPAFYAVRESAKHRNAAIRNQRIELELASLEPFISGLDEAKQREIKAALTLQYFGQEQNSQDDTGRSFPLPMKDLIDMLKNATKSK